MMEQLDKGLIDFGVVFGPVDQTKYNSLEIPFQDTWGVLMRQDSPLASKKLISPQDLWDKPLIISEQESTQEGLSAWLQKKTGELEIVATYNLLFNASLMVAEGLGYAIGFDHIINTSCGSSLCFRPLSPKREAGLSIIWKKYQIFSRASEKFMQKIKELMTQE